MLDNTLDQIIILNFAPVLAFLHIEVLDVESTIFMDDVLMTEFLSHFHDIALLCLVHHVVDFGLTNMLQRHLLKILSLLSLELRGCGHTVLFCLHPGLDFFL